MTYTYSNTYITFTLTVTLSDSVTDWVNEWLWVWLWVTDWAQIILRMELYVFGTTIKYETHQDRKQTTDRARRLGRPESIVGPISLENWADRKAPSLISTDNFWQKHKADVTGLNMAEIIPERLRYFTHRFKTICFLEYARFGNSSSNSNCIL